MSSISLFAGWRKTAKILCALFLLCLAPTSAISESLQVSIPATVIDNLPLVSERIVRALGLTGIDIDFSHPPNKRSLSMLSQGNIALEFARTPSVMSEYLDLVQLQPVIVSFKLKMITSVETPEYCTMSETDYGNMSIAGVLGINLHEIGLYPKFRNSTTLGNFPAAAEFVALQRADVSFFPDVFLATIQQETRTKLVVCENNFEIYDFYAYLHKDFLWAKESIERALHAEFHD